jgi:hypothetical protein
MLLTFVETAAFTARWKKRADDAALRRLQDELLATPNAGAPMPGCGMLRKYRFGDSSRGKGRRGGARVIYMHTPAVRWIHLIAVFGKDEQIDLTKTQMKELCALARFLRTEALAARGVRA